MIHDATVEVTCDNPNCRESIQVELPFNYPDLSGRNGRYEHQLSAIRSRIEAEEWVIVGEEPDEKTYCSGCAPEEEEVVDAKG